MLPMIDRMDVVSASGTAPGFVRTAPKPPPVLV